MTPLSLLSTAQVGPSSPTPDAGLTRPAALTPEAVRTPPARAPHRRLRPAQDLPPLPAGVWHADHYAAATQVWPTGHRALDGELPGGGWPAAALVELLSTDPGLFEGALLAPLWRQLILAHAGTRIAWVMPGRSPWVPHAPGLAHLGIPPERLLCLRPATEADAAWAVEQMLGCAGVACVWWLTRESHPIHLRRLQWAAQRQGSILFASRPLARRQDPSPAPLRAHLKAGPEQTLSVQFLKRQGPRHEQPVFLNRETVPHLLPRRSAVRVPQAPQVNQPHQPHQPHQASSVLQIPAPTPAPPAASQPAHVVDRTVLAPAAA